MPLNFGKDKNAWYNSNRFRALLVIGAIGALEAVQGSSELTNYGQLAVVVVGAALHYFKHK